MKFSLGLVVSFHLIPKAQALELSDVSILLPLPHVQELPLSLQPSSGQGLIPSSVTEKLPKLVASIEKQKAYDELLHVVAIRIDPCFFESNTFSPLACRREIRLVWQPLLANGDQVIAKDAAVHSFYDLSPADWSTFIKRYRALVAKYPSSPGAKLSVSSHFQGGYAGSYWQELRALIVDYANPSRLARVTLMSLDFNENQWAFRGWEISSAAAAMKPIQIAAIGGTGQVVALLQGNSLDFRSTVFPTSQGEIGLWFYDNSQTVGEHFSTDKLSEFISHQIEIENPLKHNPGTIDCASCHLAMATIQWGERNHAEWNWNSMRLESEFRSRYPTIGTVDGGTGPVPTNRLRAFGYFNQAPMISTRTANETAHVLEQLNEFPQ